MGLTVNAPGCNYPIPKAGTQDWLTLIAMFRGMAIEAQERANQIRAIDDPEEDIRRAKAEATSSAYAFAAQMIDLQYYSGP